MPDPLAPFRNSLLPVGVRSLAPHANPVTCVLAGRGGSLRLDRGDVRAESEILLVRPGIVHAVALPERGADVLYLSGLVFPFETPLAQPLTRGLGNLAQDALGGGKDAIDALRACLAARADTPLPKCEWTSLTWTSLTSKLESWMPWLSARPSGGCERTTWLASRTALATGCEL